jgi:peptidyl-prolyl cis-trans isomerase D
MLAAIKNKSKGPVAYLIVGIITVPFALFGINQYLGGQQNIVVATVDGEEITHTEYLPAFNRQKRSLQEQLGDNYTPQIDFQVKQQVISTLINTQLLENLADELGIATTSDEIKQHILADTTFYKDGKFDIEQYQTLLRINGYTTSDYERLIAKQINNLQLKENLLLGEFLTPKAKEQLNDLINQERNIAYQVFNHQDFAKKVQVDDAEIAEYFTKNSTNFTNPQQIKVDFVELSIDGLKDTIAINESALQTLYEENKENYTNEEERSASHILVESEALALEIIAKINSGEDFATLATQYSQDESSSADGGNLGFFGKGIMVPEFEEKVFAMSVGEVSTPVKTEFGYHIIKLDEINPSTTQDFTSVKDEITQLYIKQQAQKQIFELSERMQTLAYDGELEDIAEELDLKLQTTDFITKNNTKLDRKFISTSFSEDVLKGENVVVDISNEKIVAMRKHTFIPASTQTLNEAKDAIVNILTQEKTTQLAGQAAKTTLDSKQGFDNETWVSRTSSDVDSEIVNFAFTMSRKNLPNYASTSFANKTVVIKVLGVRVADKDNNVDSLLGDYNDEIFNDILKVIKQRTDIKIYNNRL